MILVYVSIQSLSPDTYSQIVSKASEEIGVDVRFFGYSYADLNEDPLVYRDLKQRTAEADFIIIRCMADPDNMDRFSDYEKVLGSIRGTVLVFVGNAEVRQTYRHLFEGSDEEYGALCGYLTCRGEENEINVLRWMDARFRGVEWPMAPVARPENTGLYHDGGLVDDPASYIGGLDPNRLTIGIVFDSNCWIYRDLEPIDRLIGELERRGVNTVPILFSNMVSKGHELYRSSREVLTEYFRHQGAVAVDAVIVCSGFSLLVNSKEGGTGVSTAEVENYLRNELDVPVIHVMTVRRYAEFSDDVRGLEKCDLFSQVVWPEVDGQVISVPFAVSDPKNPGMTVSIDERIDHICRLTRGWAELYSTPVERRRIAILMYQSSESSGGIGCAGGLDTVESVARILNRLESDGYSTGSHPADGGSLVEDLISGITNDLTCVSDECIRERAADLVDWNRYGCDVFDGAPDFNRDGMMRCWGEPVGNIQTVGDRIVIPGKAYGNIFVGFQPPRAMADVLDKVMHDPDIVIPHQYLEYYHWLQYDFGAQAVVHMGTHGSIEWLPGKAAGMSRSCYPDLCLDALPHMYPYLINDPGEGIQTKRRTEAVVIGHMTPPMGLAGQDGDLNRLETLVQEYLRSRLSMSDDRRRSLLSMMAEEMTANDLFEDLGLDPNAGLESIGEHVEDINDYLFGLRDNTIRLGLHILGEPLRDGLKDEEIFSIMRLRNRGLAPLRSAVSRIRGIDLERVESDPSELVPDGRTGGEFIAAMDQDILRFLGSIRESGYDEGAVMQSALDCLGGWSEELDGISRFICETLSPSIDRTTDEMDNLMHGFEGGFVPSGPSGAPTRSGADILPTGRNFYAIDPETAPTRASWETGRKMADTMIERFVEDKGTYPHEVGFIMWATDNMKTNGDDIAYVLWLMGVRPVWSKHGDRVTGTEIVPLQELGRPRIDVTIRITGLFRDTFPNSVDLIDDAVREVMNLDESDKENYLAANLKKDIEEDIKAGIPEDESRRRNSIRMFGSPPGNYGVGVDVLIDSSQWDDVRDLADAYVNWSCYAYGRGLYGMRDAEQFHRRFRKVQITVKNMSDRETDIFDVDDVYTYLGGLNAFVRAYGDNELYSVVGDDSDPDRTKLRTLEEECRYVFRSKVINPRFIDGLKRHGYSGATVLMNISKFMIGWDGTSDSLDEWMYEKYCQKVLFDDETFDWMLDVNPDAARAIIENMFEADDRGFWTPDEGTKERLRELYGMAEEVSEGLHDRWFPIHGRRRNGWVGVEGHGSFFRVSLASCRFREGRGWHNGP